MCAYSSQPLQPQTMGQLYKEVPAIGLESPHERKKQTNRFQYHEVADDNVPGHQGLCFHLTPPSLRPTLEGPKTKAFKGQRGYRKKELVEHSPLAPL